MKGNVLNLLSLSRKAQHLKMGFDAVEQSFSKDAQLLLFSSDISDNTKKRIQAKADRFGIASLTLPHTSDEILLTVGKRIAVMAVTDRGLAESVASLIRDKEDLN